MTAGQVTNDASTAVDERALARSWLVPGADPTAVGQTLRDHAVHRDPAALAALRAVADLAASIDAVAAALDADPYFLAPVPACGGVHVPSGVVRRSEPIRDELSTLAAEAASAVGQRYAADLHTSVVTFPRSGLRVRAGRQDTLRLSVDTAGAVRLASRNAALSLAPTGPGRRLEPVGAVEGLAVATFPEVAGRRVGASAVSGLGIPDFMTVSEPVSAADLSGLERTLRLIGRAAPAMFVELSTITRCVVPLVPPKERAIHSSSARQLPGVVYAVCTDPLESAAMLCHEYHHLKLFLLQERLTLMARPDAPTKAPWRPDVRKADGVLHGAYVFFGIAWLFDRLFSTLAPTRRGLRRLVVWRVCVEAGIRELRGVDWQPTDAGAALLDDMEQMNSAALDGLADQADDIAWARAAIREHLALAGTDGRREPWYLLT
jgi:HEXXH motif-containing protein